MHPPTAPPRTRTARLGEPRERSDVRAAPRAGSEHKLHAELAACYRLVAHFGMDDLIYNHISVRLPGPHKRFLINPYGLLFSEVTASCFVEIDEEGNALRASDYDVNRAGFVIHRAVHAGRTDAVCVLHMQAEAATAVSAPDGALLPL